MFALPSDNPCSVLLFFIPRCYLLSWTADISTESLWKLQLLTSNCLALFLEMATVYQKFNLQYISDMIFMFSSQISTHFVFISYIQVNVYDNFS